MYLYFFLIGLSDIPTRTKVGKLFPLWGVLGRVTLATVLPAGERSLLRHALGFSDHLVGLAQELCTVCFTSHLPGRASFPLPP